MAKRRLKQEIRKQAARMIFQQRESQPDRARLRAAKQLRRGWVRSEDMPSFQEIRNEVHLYEVRDERLADEQADRFELYRYLLMPLADIRQRRDTHPEGDVLYHSLQVFTLAREHSPYDEEFLTAALLHDIGKAIDPYDHVAAAEEALSDFVTERTLWFISQQLLARQVLDRSIGARARRRLAASDDFDELVMLARCDRDGRVPGATVPNVDQALTYLQNLAAVCG